MKYNHKLERVTTLAIKSTVAFVGLAEFRRISGGAEKHEVERINGPLPPIVCIC